MEQRDYGARGGVETFPGSVLTRRWFETNLTGVLESPFQYSHFYPFEGDEVDYWEAECDRFVWHLDREAHIASKACSCGFYSYFGEPDPTDLPGGINVFVGAIVENFGRITYGSLGLRSQYMRVKAFVLPTPRFTFRGWWTRCFRDTRTLYMGAWISAMFGGLILGVTAVITGADVLIMAGYLIGALFYPVTSMIWYYAKLRIGSSVRFRLSRERKRALKERYPGIPFYKSWEEAQKDFPVTKRSDLPTHKRKGKK